VHHVLHDLNNGYLTEIFQPVIAALEGFEPSLDAPQAADIALKAMAKE